MAAKAGEGLSSASPGLLSVFRVKNLYVGNYNILGGKTCIINQKEKNFCFFVVFALRSIVNV